MASQPLTPGDHFFTAGGITFHYRVGGTSGPLFIAHSVGWGMPGSYLWNGMGPNLEQHYRVVYFEPRGTGQSSRPADEEGSMASRVMAEDIEHLRTHLGLDALPVLLGHSNGACTVLRYAEQHPERVEKLILVDAEIQDAPPETNDFAVWAEKRKDDPVYAGAVAAFAELGANPPTTDEEFAAFMGKIMPWYFSDVAHVATLAKQQVDGDALPSVWAMQRNGPSDRKEENRNPHLRDAGKVKAKTLLLWGEEDAICSIKRGRLAAEAIPGSKLVAFEKCGHFPWIEKREDFFREVDAFVKG
ncbi:Alpha/Beta hydrolase protein [Coniochaeta sp. 2T2.1]|nr:Alpha/Beta hydrolase protein [Coniochaeta sp. 2T2.1]